jgi:hypothetical protein
MTPYKAAWEAFKKSRDGTALLSEFSWNHAVSGPFLENRIREAFDAGWNAEKLAPTLPAAKHAHEGSVTFDRGETCLKCGKDMYDPVHSQATSEGVKGA